MNHNDLKTLRAATRDGQRILRKRGGYHARRGYQRPQQARWT